MIPGLADGLVVALALGALGLFAIVVVVDGWVQQRDTLRRRLFAQLGHGDLDRSAGSFVGIIGQLRGILDEFANALGAHRWLRPTERAKTNLLLLRAGFRNHGAIVRYTAAKLTGACIGLGVAVLLVAGNERFAEQLALQVVAVLGSALAGGLVPEILVTALARRRSRAIARSLPDALDLMIIVANAGQSLDMAIDRVARELETAAPELSDELRVTMSELRGLASRREALDNLARRTGLKEVRSFTATLIQTVQYGTPLSQALKTLADEMRAARLIQLEERAAKLPAVLSLVLMTLIMPSLFIVTGGPAVLTLISVFTD